MPSQPARSTASSPPAAEALLHTDLGAWAGATLARSGRKEALLGRVEWLRLAVDGRSLEARVRGNRPLPYQVRIRVVDGALEVRCTCAKVARACKHAVAAVEALRFPNAHGGAPPPRARKPSGRGRPGDGRVVQPGRGVAGLLLVGGNERMLPRSDRIAAARVEEVATRSQQARRERAEVVPVEAGSGVWPRVEVRRPGEAVARVTLRGPKGCDASCDCPDFEENGLRTCKHIIRASRSYFYRRRDAPDNVLGCWCCPRAWLDRAPDALEEIRVTAPRREDLPPHFDPEGWLRPAPSEVDAPNWTEEALVALRELARARGWSLDLDPAVAERIDARRRQDRLAARLTAIHASGEAWEAITSRLPFRLHPYQKTGALFLARRGRAFLADDMGLGKTVQAIVATSLLRRTAGVTRTLVVCPASLKHQWRREIARASPERVCVVDGPRHRREADYGNWDAGFLVLNYELVLKDVEMIQAARPDLIILDEAQRIKNWDTKTARSVKRLESPHAFILTGTPLENRLAELHSLAEFLYPRALGPRWRLLPFHTVTEPRGRVVAYEGLDVLRRKLRPFFLRRDRAEVLDQLPERTDNTFWTDLTLLQKRPYRRLGATVAALVGRGQPLQPGEVRRVLQALTSMRILCNAHAQFEWAAWASRLAEPDAPNRGELRALGSPKLEEFARVLEDLLDESDEKIVVFSQWERMLRLARFVSRPSLEARDLRGELFHGGLPSSSRGRMIDEFRTDPEFRILFSTDAGGLGLNLQEAASIVVNLEVPWNPAVLEQRIGRVHRLGQRRSVSVLHFVTRGAIEERVRQVVENKRALFAGLLADDVDRIVLDPGEVGSWADRLRELLEGANAPR